MLVNKLSYGLMPPLMESHVFMWNKPERGDIVLFRSPIEDVTFVKRVIGVENDLISFRNGTLMLNGELVSEQAQEDRAILEDMGEPADGKTLFIENLPNNKSHHILRMTNGGTTFFESREWKIRQTPGDGR